MAVGNLQGGADVVAGSLGENEYAMTAGGGAVFAASLVPGRQRLLHPGHRPTSTATATTEIVEGGDSSAGLAYTTQYQNGGHIRVLSATGNAGQPRPNGGLVCQYTTDETVQSSPAVGEFLGSSAEVGIVAGTGTHFPGASDTNQLVALDSHCNLVWTATLDGETMSQPGPGRRARQRPAPGGRGHGQRHASGSVYA